MKSAFLLCITFVAIGNVQPAGERGFLEDFLAGYRRTRMIGQKTLTDLEREPIHLKRLKAMRIIQRKVSEKTAFPCSLNNTKSDQIPISVHKLRPGDIKVIGAMGDSLTIGNGLMATTIFEVGFQQRGLSFSGGGEGTWRQYLTLPNILKVFNPNLLGYALGPYLDIEWGSQFNVAGEAALSDNMPHQANILIKRIRSHPRVDFDKDWKMITIFIAGSDFCTEICYENPVEVVVEKHRNAMLQTLRMLRDNLPRTFVNIIVPPNTLQIANFTNMPDSCRIQVRLTCPCMIGTKWEKFRPRLANVIQRWQEVDMEIGRYQEFDREDFQVVAQPFFLNFTAPVRKDGSTDYTYFAPECFHFSQKGAAGRKFPVSRLNTLYFRLIPVANSLWNNIMEPVGRKQPTSQKLFVKFNCPSKEFPYIFTNKNSIP